MKDDGKQPMNAEAIEAQRAAARRTAWILAGVALLVFAGFIALQGWLR